MCFKLESTSSRLCISLCYLKTEIKGAWLRNLLETHVLSCTLDQLNQ